MKYIGLIIGGIEHLHDLSLNLWGNEIGNLGIYNFFRGIEYAQKNNVISPQELL